MNRVTNFKKEFEENLKPKLEGLMMRKFKVKVHSEILTKLIPQFTEVLIEEEESKEQKYYGKDNLVLSNELAKQDQGELEKEKLLTQKKEETGLIQAKNMNEEQLQFEINKVRKSQIHRQNRPKRSSSKRLLN